MIQAEQPSFFEATTAIGFLALAEARVDVAVIEVGLGGRLDSTNVIEPLVSVLTNVSLDHVQLLGPTIEDVAREKAGILKPGVPSVFGGAADAAGDIIRETAGRVGSPLHVVRGSDVALHDVSLRGTTFSYATADGPGGGTRETYDRIRTPLIGAHQAMNTTLAIEAVRRLPDALRPTAAQVEAGLAAVRWPGRLQVETIGGRPWVFDVAHNPAGVQALLGALRALDLPAPVTVLVGVLGDKDWAAMLAPLHAWADRLILSTPPTAPAERLWDVHRAADGLPDEGARVDIIPDFEAALRELAAGSDGTVLVTGSFHTVGDALAMLGRCACEPDVHLPVIDFHG
jgi:dihydrofolate synthase/folylpolyglutamate synthase